MSEGGNENNVIHLGVGANGRLVRSEPVQIQPPPPRTDAVAGLYAVSEVARLCSFSVSRLRSWHRSGLIVPSARVNGRNYYTFQDLIGVRTAKGLLDGGVPLRHVRKAVDSLRASLPDKTQPLSQLRVVADGRCAVVQDEGGSYEPATGQRVLDFSLERLESDVVRLLHFDDDKRATAYEYYLEGCELDETDESLDQAEEAYLKAISLDPALSNALTNLGNLYYRRDQIEQAEVYYRQALESDPEQPEALYNLGFLHFERREISEAITLFRDALKSDPSFADAHFNLAMALEERGDKDAARPHWRRYLALEPSGSWADIADTHLGSDEARS